jgi:hypothetical protein
LPRDWLIPRFGCSVGCFSCGSNAYEPIARDLVVRPNWCSGRAWAECEPDYFDAAAFGFENSSKLAKSFFASGTFGCRWNRLSAPRAKPIISILLNQNGQFHNILHI